MVMKTPPAGYHTVAPYLTVREAEQLIEFVRQTFGAEVRLHGIGSAGGLHAELTLGDSMIMIGGGPDIEVPKLAAIHVYVEDVDKVYKRAIEARATSLSEPIDQPYGDRMATVKDLCGNIWYIARRVADVEQG